jgi:hypothetical protein
MFRKFPHRIIEEVTAMMMMIPPMVGVPAFDRCVFGPSSLICWVILIFFSHCIMRGATTSVTTRAVRAASDVLKVI